MRPTAIAATADIKLPFVKRRGFSKIEGCPSFLENCLASSSDEDATDEETALRGAPQLWKKYQLGK